MQLDGAQATLARVWRVGGKRGCPTSVWRERTCFLQDELERVRLHVCRRKVPSNNVQMFREGHVQLFV